MSSNNQSTQLVILNEETNTRKHAKRVNIVSLKLAEKTIQSYARDVTKFQEYLKKKAVETTQPLSRFAFVRYKEHSW